jgi:hypothetical protein
MLRKSLTVGLLLAVCFVIVTIVLFYSGASASSGVSTQKALQLEQNLPPSKHPNLGHPAIKLTLLTGSQRFTVTDVKAYLSKHLFPSGPTTTGKPATIRTIEFISSKKASLLIHNGSIGLADTDQVCFVELYGPFTNTHVPVPPGANPYPVTDIGVEIFDAQTGNLLLYWLP